MDYKEKYENALERARVLKNKLEKSCSLATPTGIESIFPELAESDDERIRKALIRALKNLDKDHYNMIYLDGFSVQQCLAWLEKQGEPQPYRGNADTMRKNLIKAFKSIGSKHWGGFDVRDIIHFLESKDAIELEKQGEKHIDEKLSNLLNRVICRFINDPYIPYSERDEVSNKIIPYVEQLEKQGKQKPVDKVEPKFKVGDIITNKKSKDTVKIVQILHDSYCYSGWNGAATVHSDFNISEQDDWELVEQNHAWSDDDELMLTSTINTLKLTNGTAQIKIDWLKSLKDRVQPQQKQEWSEDDEKYINDILAILGGGRGYRSNRQIEEWIKSLKPQPHWKPTEEQLMALRDAIDNNEMESLYNDLKKL